MQASEQQLEEILSAFNISFEQVLGQKYKLEEVKNEDDKKLKKKLKKYVIQDNDTNQIAADKVTKMLQQFSKNYEGASKSFNKISELKKTVDQSQKQRDTTIKQKQLIVNVHKGFKSKYDQQLKHAQEVQRQQDAKRKIVIQSLQQRIKTIQSQYQQAGKVKIERYRQNQTLKHQTARLQPHLIASQSLYEAQLKKKAIQIQIQMTTLKQKIEMMDNFKGMKAQTVEKIQRAHVQQVKIGQRLGKINEKEDEHKILLAKAHLVFEDYKKAINTLKTVLPKREKQAMQTRSKALKAQNLLKQLKRSLVDLDTQIDNQNKQKEVLQTLQKNLSKQLEDNK